MAPKSLEKQFLKQNYVLMGEISRLREALMRRRRFLELLQSMGPVVGVWLIEVVIRGCLFRDGMAHGVYSSLYPNLQEELLPATDREQWGEIAFDEGCVAAGIWLQASWDEDSGVLDASIREEAEAVPRELEAMSLGQRRELSKSAKGALFDKLLRDPDSAVIRGLLRNPRTTEREVLNLCSRRPILPQVLEVVVEIPKWFQRYRVQWALANNPFVSPRLGMFLLPLLHREDREELIREQTAGASIRLAANKLLTLEEGLSSAPPFCLR